MLYWAFSTASGAHVCVGTPATEASCRAYTPLLRKVSILYCARPPPLQFAPMCALGTLAAHIISGRNFDAQAARKNKVFVMIEFHKRFDPIYADARAKARAFGDFGYVWQ